VQKQHPQVNPFNPLSNIPRISFHSAQLQII